MKSDPPGDLAQALRQSQELATEHLPHTTYDVVRALAFVPWNPMPTEVYISLDYRGPHGATKDNPDVRLCTVHIDHVVQPPFVSYTFEVLDQRSGRSHTFEVFVTAQQDVPLNQVLSVEGAGRSPFRGGVVVMQRDGTRKKLGRHVPINMIWASEVSLILLQEGNLASSRFTKGPKGRIRRPKKQKATSAQMNAQASTGATRHSDSDLGKQGESGKEWNTEDDE
ncbi:hypothetical protein M407DRAFT_7841 [Tulasnella calospora MUT 4182]|uniref:Uncharacterized protein n=1 Tax=Tulasnella calospora MUT 4182 TaxID=1051891 RepID=A0A0C3Q929_9AGAM|nr:hypothetical protein M407DRAFT_7841 [Tulasnella calospora MUT 4182]